MHSKDPTALTLQDQLRSILLDQIESGVFRPGDKIPSENELANIYGVSRVTVRGALNRLSKDGVLVKHQGKGTFVKPTMHVESTLTSGSFTETCLKMGCLPSTRIISAGKSPSDAVSARALGISEGEPVVKICRLRLVDDTPCIVEHDYFPAGYGFLLDTDLENKSLFTIIESMCGKRVAGFEDQFGIARADGELAALLEVDEGAPLLEVTETVAGMGDETIYVNCQFIAADRYTYVVGSRKL